MTVADVTIPQDVAKRYAAMIRNGQMDRPLAVWSIGCFWLGVGCAWLAARWSR